MIDTVRIRQPRYFKDSALRRNWEIKTIRREVSYSEGFEDELLQGYIGVHKEKGVKFFGNREQIVSVEASLPRLLFGHNGKLLTSQRDIHAALRKLGRTLDAISHPPGCAPQYTRVDLVWHVPGSCAEMILAHRDTRHPRVRKATCIYDAESITWRGSSFNLLIYDKTKKEVGQPGDFVRVEAQLRGHMLDEFLEESGHTLDFGICYPFLRRLVLQLEPHATPCVSRIAGLLAACLRLNAPESEVHPVHAYLQSLCARRRRDLRRQINGIAVESRAVNWSLLFPEGPPQSPPQLE